jgi:hypothetical protein
MNQLIERLNQYAAVPSTEYSGVPYVLVPSKLISDLAELITQINTKYAGEFSLEPAPMFAPTPEPVVEQPAAQPAEPTGETTNG